MIVLGGAWIIEGSGYRWYLEVEGLRFLCYVNYLDFLVEYEIKKFSCNMIELTGRSINFMCKPNGMYFKTNIYDKQSTIHL